MIPALFVVTLLVASFLSISAASDGVAVTLSNYNSFPLSVYWDGGKDPSTGEVIEAFIDTINPAGSIVVNTFVGVYLSYDHLLLFSVPRLVFRPHLCNSFHFFRTHLFCQVQ